MRRLPTPCYGTAIGSRARAIRRRSGGMLNGSSTCSTPTAHERRSWSFTPSASPAARPSPPQIRKTSHAISRAIIRKQIVLAVLALCCGPWSSAAELHVNELDYLEAQGLSVLVYQNQFHDVFRDQKLGGVEMILHGERIATDGEVRLLPAPEQWDSVPKFTRRQRGAAPDQLIAYSGYPDQDLSYRIEVTAE